MNMLKIPIGDWSGDGHGKCDWYKCESNKPVDEVREIHFKIKETTGFDIEKICSKYGQNTIDIDDYKELNAIGFVNVDEEWGDGFDDDVEYINLGSNDMVNLWILLLQKTDPTLELKIIKDDVVMLPFYGFDSKKRHIGFVGYGVMGL